MLPKKTRLNSSLIPEIVNNGSRFFNDNFTIFLKRADNNQVTKICVIVAMKVAKNAVVKNKIKRWVKEILRQEYTQINSGYNLVILVKKNIMMEKYPIIKAEIIKLLTSAKILNKNAPINSQKY